MLAVEAINRAILHLSHQGDTDIFPSLFEFKFYADCSNAVAKTLSEYNAGQYKPKSAVEILSPKTALAFRIAHQLYATDTLLYTAAVISIAPAIEALRLERPQGGFSYRYIPDMTKPQLFDRDSSYHDWLLHVQELCQHENPFVNPTPVIETDISDFYPRIYFHRIEHVLDDAQAPNSVRKIIEQIIKCTRANQSYGLPIGSAASRLLAEGILNDTDRMLQGKAQAFTRYVDDFRIFTDSNQSSHSLLCQLAEHLMLTEGLSLNASKTRLSDTKSVGKSIDDRLTDVFTSAEMEQINQYIRAAYDGEIEISESIEGIDSATLIAKLSEILKRSAIDYSAIKVILKALRASGDVDPQVLVREFSRLLYFVPREFCLLVGAVSQKTPESGETLADELLRIISETPFCDMALSRIWLGHLFISGGLPLNKDRFDRLPAANTVLEKRQRWLMLGLLDDRATFRAHKTKLAEINDWEKPALLLAASCLSKGEYEVWLNFAKEQLNDPLSKDFITWLKAIGCSLQELLREDYWHAEIGFNPPKAYV
jgi:hypothetical protein